MDERQQQELLCWLGSQDMAVFLVGGSVRDRMLGRLSHDLDVVVSGSAIRLGRNLADRLGGAFYILDAERGAARALLPSADGEQLTVDLTVLAEDDIVADLAARDFTINAMAMPLTSNDVGALIDPHGGWTDLQARRLRAVSSASLRNDPVRVLRAVRLAHEFGLEIDSSTVALACEAVPLLGDVSAERLRDELGRILTLSHASVPILRLNRWSVLRFLFETYGVPPIAGRDSPPTIQAEIAGAVLDAWECLSEVLPVPALCGSQHNAALFRRAVACYRGPLADRLAAVVTGERTQSLLVRWVILLCFAGGKSCVEEMLARLRFSRVEVRRGRTLANTFSRPGEWAESGETTPRQLHRFYREAKGCGPEALVLYLAERLAVPGRDDGVGCAELAAQRVESALRAYFESYETIVAPPQLVDGTVLMERFDLQAGPHIGELLERVREAQAEGEIRTQAEALAWVQAYLATNHPEAGN